VRIRVGSCIQKGVIVSVEMNAGNPEVNIKCR